MQLRGPAGRELVYAVGALVVMGGMSGSLLREEPTLHETAENSTASGKWTTSLIASHSFYEVSRRLKGDKLRASSDSPTVTHPSEPIVLKHTPDYKMFVWLFLPLREGISSRESETFAIDLVLPRDPIPNRVRATGFSYSLLPDATFQSISNSIGHRSQTFIR